MPSSWLFVLALLFGAADAKGPHLSSAEELVEQADEWLLDYDEDEDGRLSLSEMRPVLQQMRETSALSMDASAQLTVDVFMRMADADGDGAANRAELIDLLKRMKGFAAGRLERSEAASPNADSVASSSGSGYSESHEERMRKRKKKGGARKRAHLADQTLQPKDEM